MGGVGEIGGAYQLLATVYVHAPGPFQRAMRMVKFPNQASFESQDWIRKNVSGFGALSPDYEKAFEAYPTLFDTLYGDGEEGVFETVFADIRDEPDGPRVDLKKEIVAQLTGSVSFAMLPLDDGSSDVAIQIRVRDEQRFADSIRKLFEGDEQAKAKRFPNHTVWEISPMEEDGQKNSRLETVAITVKDSHFVWASSPATLRRLTTDKDDSDGQAFHVNEIRDELKRRTGGSACLVSFADLETVYRQTYRQLHNSELSQPSATISNAIGMFDSFKRADPHKLPDFETIRHYLTGAFGMAAVTTPRGWRIVIVVQ